MAEPHVLYALDGHVATITLNRPAARNAFTAEMVRLWCGRLAEARADDAVRAVVLTGAGDTFCSGGDIREMAEGRLQAAEMKRFLWEGVHRVALAMEDFDKPVVAAINGAAMGAGLDMALLCDLRVCSATAKLAESYVLLGLAPGDGGAWLLPRVVGLPRALELLLTGEPIAPQRALEIGLVNAVVPPERVREEAAVLAGRIAALPPLAVRTTKRAVYDGLAVPLRAHLDAISSHLALLSQTADHREAAQAFLARRRPEFTGK